MPVNNNSSRFNISQSVYGSMNSGSIAGFVTGSNNNVNASEERQTIAEAAAEIEKLLDKLSQSYPITTVADKATVAAKVMEEIEKNHDTKIKIIKALKSGGIYTLIELTNNPVVKILTPMLESLLEEGTWYQD